VTLDEARALVGHKVEYRSRYMGPDGDEALDVEEGVITSVTAHYVFVRYRDDHHSKATNPADLELAPQPAPPSSDTPACSPDPKT
jgi:hypothetical protein